MTQPIEATVYFDYLCPFAYRTVRLFTEMEQARADVSVTWRFFSLEQVNAVARGKSEAWQVWEQPLDYETLWRRSRSRILAPFLASYAAQRQGSQAFARFRLAVFHAYHHDRLDTSNPDVLLDIARRAELNLADFTAHWQSQQARDQLRRDHLGGLDVGVFGVPTVIVNNCEATYLRLSEYPESATERQILFDELVHLLTRRLCLQEFKRASAA